MLKSPWEAPAPLWASPSWCHGAEAGPGLAETPSVSGGSLYPLSCPSSHLPFSFSNSHMIMALVSFLSRMGVLGSGSQEVYGHSPSGAPCTRGREAATSLIWRGECVWARGP